MGRFLCPRSIRWEGPDAQYTPESDDIPWAFVPERKITVEDIKYILSSYFQGTPYNPYGQYGPEFKAKYRPIGISRTGVMAVLQLRGYMPGEIAALEWICFGPNPFNALLPVYPNTDRMPAYLSKVTTAPSTETFYWTSRLIGALADAHYADCIQLIERYQSAMANKGHALIHDYDREMCAKGDYTLIDEANRKLADMAKAEAGSALSKVLLAASDGMKCTYKRTDN